MNIKDDSRMVKPGDTFVAIRGILSDGHDYINTAILNGATKIIAESGQYSVETVIVPDTHVYITKYLHDTYFKMLSKMKFIGITGTNGKTTCAYLTHSILNDMGHKTAYIGTIGYYIKDKIRSLNNTTPDVILLYELMLDALANNCEYIVMEASSQGLAYNRMDGLAFDYVAFTNLTQDHLDYHLTMENYALAKQKLFKMLNKEGTSIINNNDPYHNYFMLSDNHNITYGYKDADYILLSHHMDGNYTCFAYQYQNQTYETKTRLLGDYNLENLMLVITLIRQMGYTDVDKYIPTLKAPPGRMQFIDYKDSTIIIDYAHTPDAFTKLVEIIKDIPKQHLYAVFGVGGDRDRGKRPIMMDIMSKSADYCILTDEDPRTEDNDQIYNDLIKGAANNNYIIEKDRVKAIEMGIKMLKHNDILIILGKGHEEFIIMKDYKIPFNDYETVKRYIESNTN